MPQFQIMKKNARLALHAHWGKAISAVLVLGGAGLCLRLLRTCILQLLIPPAPLDPAFAFEYGLESYLFEQFARISPAQTVIAGVFSVLELLLLAPLGLGVIRWFFLLVQGKSPALAEVFCYFKHARQYARAVWLEINLLVRPTLWAAAFFAAPGSIFSVSLAVVARGEPTRAMLAVSSVGVLIAVFLSLLLGIFYCAFMNRYLLAAYLVCEDDALPVRKAIRNSVQFTKEICFRLYGFHLSFILWMILCVLILPALYVFPYMIASQTVYSRFITEKSRTAPPEPTREFDPAQFPNGELGI